MKKLLASLVVLGVSCAYVVAAEVPANGVQDSDVDAAGLVAIINKQPKSSEISQTVKVRRSGLVLVVNVNGKVQVQKEEK